MSSRYVSYTAFTLIAEINSIFLHSRKLMQFAGISFKSMTYRINCAINLWTFVIFRMTSLASICYGMHVWYARTGLYFYTCLVLSMFVMVPINIILLWRLACSDIFRSRFHKQSKISNGNGHASSEPVSNGRNITTADNHNNFSSTAQKLPINNNHASHTNGIGSATNGFHVRMSQVQNGHSQIG